MHSSRMRTARSLTVSRRVLHMPPSPLAAMHAPWQPHTTPQQPHMPPTTMHTPHNHTCPPTTMHIPLQSHTPSAITDASPQPCTPPCNHAHPPINRITDTCKNITFPQLRLRAVKIAITLQNP